MFGPVHNRTNNFLIRSSAIFRKDDHLKFTIQKIEAQDHPPFSFQAVDGSPTTTTERDLYYLLEECVVSQELLTKAGKLGSLVSKKCSMTREKFWWLVRQVRKISSVELDVDGDERDVEDDTGISIDSHRVKTKQNIFHFNFSLEADRLLTEKETIRFRSSIGFRVLRQLFHSGFGSGVRKTFPALRHLHINSENPLQLQNGDTTNLADAPLHLHEDDDTECWFYKNAVGTENYLSPNCNFIRWVFDTRSRTCRISTKYAALVVGSCNANFLTELIDRLDDEWGPEAIDKLTTDVFIEIDSDAWEISAINRAEDSVLLYNKDTDTTIERSIEYCMSRIM